MSVPFLDLGRLHATIRDELDAAIASVVDRNAFVGGDDLASFEAAFADAHGAPAAAACNSGTDALALALRAGGIGPGDEVVVPSMTFVATAEAVLHVGAEPVLADVDPDTLLLTAQTVEDVSTARTRAVIPVHLYGTPVSFDLIEAWRGAGLWVLEDAAQAHLATEGGRPVGSAGHAAAFSFFPGKNLGAFGDAGAVVSHDPTLIETVRRLRDHGRTTKYRHDVLGWSSRMDGLQAAVLRVKLRHLAAWTEARRERARVYARLLQQVPGVSPVTVGPGSVHHLLVVRSDDRERVRAELSKAGVATGIHYPLALSQQPALAAHHRRTPVAEAAADTVLSLPMDPLMSLDSVQEVVERLAEVVRAPG